MSRSQEVLVIRHPQTVANAAGRYTGRTNSPITPVGEAQVRWLARVIAAWEPEIAYASPLARAAETARVVMPDGKPVEIWDELQEIDFGQAEGHTFDELVKMGIRMDYDSGGPIVPAGESADAFHERVRRAGSRVRAEGRRAVILTHGGVLRHLLTYWLDLPFSDSWRFAVPNAAVALVRLPEGSGVLAGLTPPPASTGGPAHVPWL